MNTELKTGTVISISMDHIWAGSGNLRHGVIENCGAQFCDDNDKSLSVYDAIESAIAAGKHEITVEIDGASRLIAWSITE